MPKDYKNIQSQQKTPSSSGIPERLIAFFFGLMCGLCIAVIGYFYSYDGDAILPPKPLSPKVIIKNEAEPLTFDFYQILPDIEVNVSEWEAEVAEDVQQKTVPDYERSRIYILQVGSFSEREVADEVKQKLALMGITAAIQRVVIHGKDIRYRVRSGPYHDMQELQAVSQQLSDSDLNYIVLRLKGK